MIIEKQTLGKLSQPIGIGNMQFQGLQKWFGKEDFFCSEEYLEGEEMVLSSQAQALSEVLQRLFRQAIIK